MESVGEGGKRCYPIVRAHTHTHTRMSFTYSRRGCGLFQSVRAVMSRPVYFGLPWEYAWWMMKYLVEEGGGGDSFCWLRAMMDGDDGIWDKSIGKVSVGNRRYFSKCTPCSDFGRPFVISLLKLRFEDSNEIFSSE